MEHWHQIVKIQRTNPSNQALQFIVSGDILLYCEESEKKLIENIREILKNIRKYGQEQIWTLKTQKIQKTLEIFATLLQFTSENRVNFLESSRWLLIYDIVYNIKCTNVRIG
jgi:hypothetical protein